MRFGTYSTNFGRKDSSVFRKFPLIGSSPPLPIT